MGKKQNLYSSVDATALKRELQGIIDYLNGLDVFNLEDDILYKPTAKGGIAPSVVSTIEKKIITALRIISQCGNIALALFEKKGEVDEFLESIMSATINRLKSIQEYYDKQPISEIQHRFVSTTNRDKEISFLANSKEDQIVARTTISEKILLLLPIIEKIEEVKNSSSLKGDKEIPASMLYE